MGLVHAAFDFSPVDILPECGELVGTAVLEIKIIGMFPNIEGKERRKAVGDGVFGVFLLGYYEMAIPVGAEPNPPTAEEGDTFLFEFLFEGFDRAESGLDDGLKIIAHRVGIGRELAEIEGMVKNLTSIVEKRATGFADDIRKGQAVQAATREEFVKIVNVGFKMFAMMEREGFAADCIVEASVGEFRHREKATDLV